MHASTALTTLNNLLHDRKLHRYTLLGPMVVEPPPANEPAARFRALAYPPDAPLVAAYGTSPDEAYTNVCAALRTTHPELFDTAEKA